MCHSTRSVTLHAPPNKEWEPHQEPTRGSLGVHSCTLPTLLSTISHFTQSAAPTGCVGPHLELHDHLILQLLRPCCNGPNIRVLFNIHVHCLHCCQHYVCSPNWVCGLTSWVGIILDWAIDALVKSMNRPDIQGFDQLIFVALEEFGVPVSVAKTLNCHAVHKPVCRRCTLQRLEQLLQGRKQLLDRRSLVCQ
jgi:hypothetical protein